MGQLALTYSILGRHAEALAMQQSVLELFRRVLPEGHLDIGERLNASFSSLGLTFLQRRLVTKLVFATNKLAPQPLHLNLCGKPCVFGI